MFLDLIGSSRCLNALVKHMCSRGWEIIPVEIRGPSTSMKFLGIQSGSQEHGRLSTVKDKLLYRPPATTEKNPEILISFDIEGNLPHLVMLCWPTYQVTHTATNFDQPRNREWSPVGIGCSVTGLGFMTQQIQWWSKSLGKWGHCIHTHQQTSIKERQRWALRFWGPVVLILATPILLRSWCWLTAEPYSMLWGD